jgi:malic enzyme
MDGNCLIFKAFAGVDGFPQCLATQDTNDIVETVKRIAPVFGQSLAVLTWRILSRLTTPPLAY